MNSVHFSVRTQGTKVKTSSCAYWVRTIFRYDDVSINPPANNRDGFCLNQFLGVKLTCKVVFLVCFCLYMLLLLQFIAIDI